MEKKDTESSLCKKYYDRLLTAWPHFPTVVCATLVFGVLAHGSALFNKYSMVDDPQYLFGWATPFGQGVGSWEYWAVLCVGSREAQISACRFTVASNVWLCWRCAPVC